MNPADQDSQVLMENVEATEKWDQPVNLGLQDFLDPLVHPV